MGFDFGAFASGFAKRDMEIRDEARKEAKEIAATTLKYRAERAMEEEAERKSKIDSAKKFGMELKTTFGFGDQHVLALAKTGQLENTVAYMRKLAGTKGAVLPKADDIVTVSGRIPKGKSFDDHLASIVGGVPTQVDPKTLYKTDDDGKKRGLLESFFNPDFRESEFQKASEAFSGAFGMDIMQKYGEDGEYADFAASINMKPIMEQLNRDDVKPFEGLSSTQINASNIRTANTLSNVFSIKSVFDSYNNFQGVEGQGDQTRAYWRVADAVRIKTATYMRDEGLDYDTANTRVQREMESVINAYEAGTQRQEAMLAWANDTTYDPTRSNAGGDGTPIPETKIEPFKPDTESFVDFMDRIPDSVVESAEGQAILSGGDTEEEKATKMLELATKTTTTTEVADPDKEDPDTPVPEAEIKSTVDSIVKSADIPLSTEETDVLTKVMTKMPKGLDLTNMTAIRNFVTDEVGAMYSGMDSMRMVMLVDTVSQLIYDASNMDTAIEQETKTSVAPRMRSRN